MAKRIAFGPHIIVQGPLSLKELYSTEAGAFWGGEGLASASPCMHWLSSCARTACVSACESFDSVAALEPGDALTACSILFSYTYLQHHCASRAMISPHRQCGCL